MNEFYVIDVETANADYSSICQIGIVKFVGDKITDKWSTLINPEDFFDDFNVSIHGISEDAVVDAPNFIDYYPKLKEILEGSTVCHHMAFDRVAINRVCEENNLLPLDVNWLDSARIVRRTWEEFAYSGYGLANVAETLGIEFKHHDALEDAIAVGKILLMAFERTELTIKDWFSKIKSPINSSGSTSSRIKLEGNPDGVLYGESVVFTGALATPRVEAAKLAADLGCNVGSSVTKKTTMLVVGIQDTKRLGGYSKSSKQRKAEEYIAKGINIRILSENDFIAITEV